MCSPSRAAAHAYYMVQIMCIQKKFRTEKKERVYLLNLKFLLNNPPLGIRTDSITSTPGVTSLISFGTAKMKLSLRDP